MGLYGISGRHTTEACPLNNSTNAKMVLGTENVDIEKNCRPLK